MDSTDTSMYAIGCKRIKMEDCETKATDHEIIDGNLDANSYVITEIKQEDQSNQDMTTTTSTTLLNPIEQEHIIPDECGTSIESQSKEDLIEVFKIEIDEFDEHQLNEVEDPGPSRDMKSAERKRRSREKMKQNPEIWRQVLAKEMERSRIRRERAKKERSENAEAYEMWKEKERLKKRKSRERKKAAEVMYSNSVFFSTKQEHTPL